MTLFGRDRCLGLFKSNFAWFYEDRFAFAVLFVMAMQSHGHGTRFDQYLVYSLVQYCCGKGMKYEINEDMTPDEAGFIQQGLLRFADRFTGPRNYKEFGITLRNEHGKVCGGITGNTIWNWLRIDVLWLPEDLRGRGFGRRLLERAEDLARTRGCDSSMLETFDFEAREFYEACGYVVRSQLDDFPRGHTHFRLTKAL